jgi:serine/threonine protein kinase
MGRLHPVPPANSDALALSTRVPASHDGLRVRSLTSAALPFAITPHLTLWRLLGEGGASRVYEGHDRRLARRVAVKLLGPRDGHDGTARERLLREAELYARIEDPRTPGVYEVSSLGDGTPYVVMEYVAGQSLSDRLRQEPPGLVLACEITSEILSALASVHRHGVVHRDVKPSNIILEQSIDGRLRARLVDFGIAKSSAFSDLQLTVPGSLLGTPQYMAPEQLAGSEADARADLYAAGLVFYELLLGAGPHRKSSIGDLVAARMRDDLDLEPLSRAGIPTALCEFLRRALARNPDARFGSADEMQCELHAARAEQNCAWVSPLASEPPRLAGSVRPPEDPSRTPRGVLDASGLHPFNEDELYGVRPARGRAAVYGLLVGFGLTFGAGVWLLQPQLTSGLRTDDVTQSAATTAAPPASAAASTDLPFAPMRELAAQPPTAASLETTEQPPAAPPPVEASALAPGAVAGSSSLLGASHARLASDPASAASEGETGNSAGKRRGSVEARRAPRETSKAAAKPARSEHRASQSSWDLAPIESSVPVAPALGPEGVPLNPY